LTLLALYLLALLDGLLCGLRASMGRCAVIRKNGYYGRAAFRGVAGAQIISTLALAALLVVAATSSNRAVVRADLEGTASRMLWVFVPYAVLVVSNLALRLVPSNDIRSATSVFMLGPLTAIRPLVMIAGVLYGVYSSRLLETRILGLFVLLLMLSLEFALNRRADRRQEREIRALI
jgi:L-asparagine transporter-like permease